MPPAARAEKYLEYFGPRPDGCGYNISPSAEAEKKTDESDGSEK
jgi:hypothetical protein